MLCEQVNPDNLETGFAGVLCSSGRFGGALALFFGFFFNIFFEGCVDFPSLCRQLAGKIRGNSGAVIKCQTSRRAFRKRLQLFF